MKKEEKKTFIQCCILGAIGGILMAAGDWLLGCVPLQKTDTGMFNRACYLSGAYALWKPALVVGMGALGCFLYSFMVKALNTDIDARYTRTKAIQYFCGLFTVVVALAIHLWAAMHARIIRTQTEALSYCNDWYVGDKIPVLEKLRNQMQI